MIKVVSFLVLSRLILLTGMPQPRSPPSRPPYAPPPDYNTLRLACKEGTSCQSCLEFPIGQNLDDFFKDRLNFNCPEIKQWDTSGVTSMERMFYGATAFNQNISLWNTGSVTSMYGMFGSASAFNQPLDSWNVKNVTSMERMFNGATVFNQTLDSWNTGSVTSMDDML